MEQRIGPVDRAIRIWTGALLGPTAIGILTGVIELPTTIAPVCGLTAIYMFTTGLSRRSLVYSLLGIDTRVRN